MKFVNLRNNFVEKSGKYEVRYNTYSDINMYVVSKEYYSSAYEEDIRVSIVMSTEEGVVSDLSIRVNVINVERISKRRELIAFEVKQSVAKHIEQLKSRHNNVLDIDFVKDVVSFILNYNVCNRYEVVVEEEAIELNKADKVNFNKSFEVNVNGLVKSYSITTEEVDSQYGYNDLLCKVEATSTIFVDGEYAVIRAYAEVYDGVVISLDIGQSRVHKQLESFVSLITAKDVSKTVNELIDNIKYEASSYIYEKDFAFVESVMTMVLNINSFDTDTYLYNNTTYNLVDVA